MTPRSEGTSHGSRESSSTTDARSAGGPESRLDVLEGLIPLPGTSLAVLPVAALRIARYPIGRMLTLASSDLAAATDAALAEATVSRRTRCALGSALDAALDVARGALFEVARDPLFREAVAWTNPRLLKTILRPRPNAPSSAKGRRRRDRGAAIIATWLQQLCLQHRWSGIARVSGRRAGYRVAVDDRLCTRRVQLEPRCIDALALALSSDPTLRPWAPARLMPDVWMDGRTIGSPFRAPIELSHGHAALFGALDGRTPARLVVKALRDRGENLSEAEAFALLEEGVGSKLVGWDYAVPPEGNPERALREALERIEEPPLRAHAVGHLERIERARDRVATSLGDPVALERALEELEAATAMPTGSGARPSREGHPLVHDRGSWEVRVDVGTDLLARVAGPLALVARSTRWVRQRIATAYREQLDIIFDELSKGRGAPVRLAELHERLAESARALRCSRPDMSTRLRAIQEALQARWLEIFDIRPLERRLVHRSIDLSARVTQAFVAPGARWEDARGLALDILIAAESAEDLERGEGLIVLGEAYLWSRYESLAPRAGIDELAALQRGNGLAPRVIPVLPRSVGHRQTHCAPPLLGELRYWFSADTVPPAEAPTVRAADMLVVRRAGRLRAVDSAGRCDTDVIELMEPLFATMCDGLMQILPRDRYMPRVAVDDVVVARETWCFEASELAFVHASAAIDRWLAVRRLRLRTAMPRFVLVDLPTEAPARLVDFDSPSHVEQLCRGVREATATDSQCRVVVSEMLPGPSDAWLPDAEGNRYTGELRLVLFEDETGARAPLQRNES